MHHRELGRKKDVKGIMIRADHIIQSRQPPSPSLSLFSSARQFADPVGHYAMCESFWSRTVLCLGEHSWQIFAKHEQAWKHKELYQHHQNGRIFAAWRWKQIVMWGHGRIGINFLSFCLCWNTQTDNFWPEKLRKTKKIKETEPGEHCILQF